MRSTSASVSSEVAIDRMNEVERRELPVGVLEDGEAGGVDHLVGDGVERADDLRRRLQPVQGPHLEGLVVGLRLGSGGALSRLLEGEGIGTEPDGLPELEPLALHRLLVHEGAVGAVQIVEDVAVLLLGDLGVLSRDAGVVDDDVVQRGAADEARRLEHEPPPQKVTI